MPYRIRDNASKPRAVSSSAVRLIACCRASGVGFANSGPLRISPWMAVTKLVVRHLAEGSRSVSLR
jgi:hypothetical protein